MEIGFTNYTNVNTRFAGSYQCGDRLAPTRPAPSEVALERWQPRYGTNFGLWNDRLAIRRIDADNPVVHAITTRRPAHGPTQRAGFDVEQVGEPFAEREAAGLPTFDVSQSHGPEGSPDTYGPSQGNELRGSPTRLPSPNVRGLRRICLSPSKLSSAELGQLQLAR